MIPPSSPSGPITSEVSEWMRATAPVPVKKSAQRAAGQVENLGRRPPGRRATEEQDPAADQDAEDRGR